MKNKLAKPFFIAILFAALAGTSHQAKADIIIEVPTVWRLQQYIGGVTTVWYTSSGCTNGNLSLGSATQAEVDRFWSLVLTAKLANRKIGVLFTNCIIDSFFIETP